LHSRKKQGPRAIQCAYADDDTDSRFTPLPEPSHNYQSPHCNLGDLIDKKQKKTESAIKEIGGIQLWNFRLALNEIAEYDMAVHTLWSAFGDSDCSKALNKIAKYDMVKKISPILMAFRPERCARLGGVVG
jgi:hypothetical protein